MTGTNHGLTGAVIALIVKEPLLAVPLSFASHFVCDAIPHFGVIDHPGGPDDELFGRKFNIILVTDFLVAVSLMVVIGMLFPAQRWLIWWCMVAAAIPDSVSAYYRLYIERIKKRKPHYDRLYLFHRNIQWSETHYGWLVEVPWFLLMGMIVINHLP